MLCVFCAPCSSSNDQPPSKAVKRATVTPSSIAAVRRGKREVCLNSCLDLNGNFRPSSPVAGDFWEETKAQSCHAENRTVLEDVRLSSEQNQHCISEGRRTIWLLTSISFLLESSHSRLYFGSVSEMHRLNWMNKSNKSAPSQALSITCLSPQTEVFIFSCEWLSQPWFPLRYI